MNVRIKTFSLVTITLCVFVIAIVDVIDLVNRKNQPASAKDILATPVSGRISPAGALNPGIDQPATTIKFFETQFDFGTIKQGDVVKHNFEFMNTGTAPLLIQSATASCGCTIPSYPKDPVAPGIKGVIEVQFNSTGKDGLQNKNITVTGNTVPNATVINITANVVPKS